MQPVANLHRNLLCPRRPHGKLMHRSYLPPRHRAPAKPLENPSTAHRQRPSLRQTSYSSADLSTCHPAESPSSSSTRRPASSSPWGRRSPRHRLANTRSHGRSARLRPAAASPQSPPQTTPNAPSAPASTDEE